MKKFKVLLIITVFVFSFISLFTCYDCVAKGVTSGLYLCCDVIIPSLFPVLCITSFLAECGLINVFAKYTDKISRKLFKMSGYFIPVFLISIVSGYPVGASISNSLYQNGRITLTERNNMASVCCSAGPSFLVVAVGVAMLKSYSAGMILLISHILASIAVAVLISRFFKPSYNGCSFDNNVLIGDAMVKGVGSACGSVISICSYTVLFSAIVNVISKYLRSTVFYLPIVSVLEVTNSVYTLCSANVSISLIAAAVGFGGLSVIFQISSVLGNFRPPISKIIFVRLLHSLFSYIFCNITLNFFDYYKPIFKSTQTSFSLGSKNIVFSISLLILAIVFFNFFYKSKRKNKYF